MRRDFKAFLKIVLPIFGALYASIAIDLIWLDTENRPIEVMLWDLSEVASWFALGMQLNN